MPEIRWILLGLGALLLVGIWWWGTRKSSQARAGSELRGADFSGTSALTAGGFDAPMLTDGPLPAGASLPAEFTAHPVLREPPIAPFAPLRISTAESDPGKATLEVPVIIEPPAAAPASPVTAEDLADAASVAEERAGVGEGDPGDERPSEQFARPPVPLRAPRTDSSGRFSRLKRDPAKPAEQQKIISVRVCAPAQAPWDGAQLASALSATDLVHGRYGIFHRLHADGRSVFSVASLHEPGVFDPARMHEQLFTGVTIFSILPGPIDPLRAFDDLMSAARHLAEQLAGMMQDEKGMPLSPTRAAELREEIVGFQRALAAARD